jgi:uroporphyrinogen decarboxylase
MTPRERVKAILSRKTPDRLPREFKLTPPLAEEFTKRTGASDPAEYYDFEMREVFFKPPSKMPDFSHYFPEGAPPLPNNKGWEVGEWGVGQKPGSTLHFIHIENPMKRLTSISELKKYPFPDMTLPERHKHLDVEVKSLHDKGYFVIGYMEWTIFEIAWHMRGMEEFFSDLSSNPKFAEYLLERICENRCFQSRRFAEAGVDMIRIGDDVGTQRGPLMSPHMYRKWIKPRHKRVIDAARKVLPSIDFQYHSCGDCSEVIPDLIDAGVTILNPVQPECMDQRKIKREYGKYLCFWGGIGTQTTMPFATPDEVYQTVHKTINTLGPTGYVPSPTHVLEPEVPFKNIEAYLRAVEEYGFTK